MATTARVGIDIIGRDRSRAAFGSAERSLSALLATARRVKSVMGLGLFGFSATAAVRSLVEISSKSSEVASSIAGLQDATQTFARSMGEGGLNSAIITVSNSMAGWMQANDATARGIGGFLATEVADLMRLIDATERAWTKLKAAFDIPTLTKDLQPGGKGPIGGTRGMGGAVFNRANFISDVYTNTAAKADQDYVPAVKRAAAATEQFRRSAEMTAPVVEDLGQAFADQWSGDVASAVNSVVSGTAKISEAITGMVSSILEEMTRLAINKTFAALFNAGAGFFAPAGPRNIIPPGAFGGSRQHGGPVERGKFYTVGERGPETLVAGSDGTVIPSRASGGGMRQIVNITPPTGFRAERRSRESGGVQITDIVFSAIDQYMSGARGQKVMGQRFGLRPQLTQRG